MAYTQLQLAIYAWFQQIPKEAPAIFALIVFFLVGCANLAITCKTKAWFMLTVACTAALEVAGYAFRIVMLHEPAYDPYVAMQALLIISPIFLALVDYSAVGKLMKIANGGGRLRPAWVRSAAFHVPDFSALPNEWVTDACNPCQMQSATTVQPGWYFA